MQPTLQEVAAAAIRDFEAREARRARRTARVNAGRRPAPPRKVVRIEPPLAEAFQQWEDELLKHPAPIEAPVPTTLYLKLIVAGLVLAVAVFFGLLWAREAAAWRSEARARQHQALVVQGRALQGQIDSFTRQVERLDEKASVLAQYATDQRFSFPGYDDSHLTKQVGDITADRDRLQAEIADRRRQLARLRQDLAKLAGP